jgi:hypothetical protein
VSLAAWADRKAATGDAEERLARLPTSSTKKGAAVPFPFVDRKVIHDAHTDSEINARISKAPVVDVPLKGLRSIQHSVKPDRVHQYLEDPGLRPPGDVHSKAGTPVDHPIVIVQGGQRILWDGNHRSTASYLRGDKTIRARVVDFDKHP